MSSQRENAPTAFGGLQAYVERSRLRCPACGHVDADGEWEVATSGGRVRYRHVCPSCEAVDTFDLTLGEFTRERR